MTKEIPDTNRLTGLKEPEIQSLRKQFGKNVFYQGRSRKFYHVLWDIAKEPMFLMLLIACSIYFILGESEEGFLMLVAMLFVTAISVYQEAKSNKAIVALKQYTEPKVTVIRNTTEQIIFSEELLPGDIMILEEGSRIPADAIVIQQNDLSVNESIITGESMPVEKNTSENNDQLFQGTTINSGKCYAQVTAIGNNTVLGKLGRSISSTSSSKTLLQSQINRFVKNMALIGSIAFAAIWLVNYLDNKDILQSLLFGLTIAMSVVPEEIPVAFSSFMALGAYRMAKQGIITRQPQTIENLGAISVICLDKTGTITENKMQVKTIYDHNKQLLEDIDEAADLKNSDVLRYAWLASESDPFDAMEKAIVELYQLQNKDSKNKPAMIHEYPLGGQPPMMTHVYEINGRKTVAAKGAPERILNICKMDIVVTNKIKELVGQMASNGYRIIAVSSAVHNDSTYPTSQDDFDWKFEGLLALYDPPKKNVRDEFKHWYDAGIKIKLITGDYAATAMNIASQVGMKDIQQKVNGEQVMGMSIEQLKQVVKTTNIFARMFPDAKLKVIDALKANGEIVAMTGDGVNDGPALKSSHIGVAMGNKGTEIAKEASGLIVTDDNLEKITAAIQDGRRIYNNLKKAVRYIISIHIPIILTASLPVLLGWKYPNIFTPIHVIFLELIMGPTCSIFYEREPGEANILIQPPRPRTHNIFLGNELLISIVQGLVITAGMLFLYYFFMHYDFSIEYTRTIVFTTLILSNIFLTFVNRSFEETLVRTIRYKNSLAPLIIVASVIFLFLLHFVSPIQQLFQLRSISLQHFLICTGVSLACIAWFELYKMSRRNIS